MLGATSTDGWMRRLGRRWKRLHRAIYGIGVVALLHYFIQSKSNVSEPVFMTGLFVWLMLWRALPMGWQRSPIAQLGLTVVAAFAAVGIEFGWYGLATGINPWRVLAANETLSYGLRPAHYVALVGLAVTLLSGVATDQAPGVAPPCLYWAKASDRGESAIMTGFATIRLPAARDAIAPDGSDVRLLLSLKAGGMAHFELAPGETSTAVVHRTVEEIWYFLSGRGEMWRRQGDQSGTVDVRAGVCLTIPPGTCFQFRSVGDEPLAAIGITMPPWPGDGEAVVVTGPWQATVPR